MCLIFDRASLTVALSVVCATKGGAASAGWVEAP
jgi:hypothetical protein